MIIDKVPFPLFLGGYGCGKSQSLTFNVFETLFVREPFAGCKIGVYAPVYDQIKLNLVPKFQQFFDSTLGGRIKYTYNKNDKILYLPEGKQIIFRSTDNPDSLVGYDHYQAHSDESDTQTADKAALVHRRIQSRNRQVHPAHGPQGTRNIQCDYTTPESYRFTYKKWGKDPAPGFRYVRAPTWSNPQTVASYVRGLLATYTPQQQLAYLKGIWCNLATGSVYSYFDPERHGSARTIKPGDTLHIGIDFNAGGCCVAVYVLDRWQEKGQWRVAVHQVLEFAEHRTLDVRQSIERIAKAGGNRVILYPDSTGNHASSNASASDIEILRGGGWEIKATTPPRIEDRVNAVNRLFYRNMLFINRAACPESWAARLEHAYSKLTGKPDKFPGPGTIDDRNDAADYPLEKLFPFKEPIAVPRQS